MKWLFGLLAMRNFSHLISCTGYRRGCH